MFWIGGAAELWINSFTDTRTVIAFFRALEKSPMMFPAWS
jgi:hypothetical protein